MVNVQKTAFMDMCMHLYKYASSTPDHAQKPRPIHSGGEAKVQSQATCEVHFATRPALGHETTHELRSILSVDPKDMDPI